MTKRHDDRFDVPLYSVAEAARYVGVPATTFASWATGYVRRSGHRPTVTGAPLLSTVDAPRGPSVTFIGLAEGVALAAIRKTGVPMQRIRPALLALQEEFGVAHALATKRLYTDGAEVLYDFSQRSSSTATTTPVGDLVVIRNGQRVFKEVIDEYLQRIEYGSDGYAELIHLPTYRRGQVVADPARSFGQPVFVRGASRVDDVIDRFVAGESIQELSVEFGVPVEDLEDALRVASQRAA